MTLSQRETDILKLLDFPFNNYFNNNPSSKCYISDKDKSSPYRNNRITVIVNGYKYFIIKEQLERFLSRL